MFDVVNQNRRTRNFLFCVESSVVCQEAFLFIEAAASVAVICFIESIFFSKITLLVLDTTVLASSHSLAAAMLDCLSK